MAFGYPPYPGVYQQNMYPQMAQGQNTMMMQGQQMPIQNQQMQPPQTMQQVAAPFAQQNNGMIWVAGKEEADKWPVLSGNAVALWDSNAPVIYLRQADNTGKPSTDVYDLVKRTDEPQPQRQTPQIDLSNYMTISDAEEMIDRRVNDILSERLKKPVNGRQKKEDE